ncbi:MAG: hypothetical protein IJ473_00595 [Alphaproteobacteria bacterium]|jgi:hypothetical protein|nr:hypothetical protein [Alphaproteobacteria bacterium]MBQ8660068.1 hypothetical protein [Alphaproteobacteria bacterium]MBR4316751.1 hypothetical protein [Alphaproteobacteria bacterium]
MANYSDNPSMDEILKRIKKALADREKRAEVEMTIAPDDNVQSFPLEISPMDKVVEEPKKSQDIFIKPNVKSEKSGVFVLTKDMKLNSMAKITDTDFQQLCFNIADEMSKDLAMAYMGPKMETWLLNHFWEVVAKSKKNLF